jgi:hypothetical protein
MTATLGFTAISIRAETRARRVSNQIALMVNHREIWKEQASSPQLARVTDPTANLCTRPASIAEESFVIAVILQTYTAYEAMKDNLLVKQDGLHRDIKSFFSLPLPYAVWTKIRSLQNLDFILFFESSLR